MRAFLLPALDPDQHRFPFFFRTTACFKMLLYDLLSLKLQLGTGVEKEIKQSSD